MSDHNAVSPERKAFGYFLGGVKEFFNGFDTGSGYVKLPIWIAGLTVTAIFAPYVLVGAGLFALIYFGRAMYDEYQNNKKEQEKIAEKQKLRGQLLLLEEEFIQKIHHDLSLQLDVQTFILNQRLTRKTEQEINHQKKQILQKKFTQLYPAFDEPLYTMSNKELLKHLLRAYFEAISKDESVLAQGGKLPSQSKMLSLIQKVTGYNPLHADFHNKMHILLEGDAKLQMQFHKLLPQGELNQPSSNRFLASFKNKIYLMTDFIKKQKKLRHIGKKCLDFINDFGTGAGITAGLLGMFGFIGVGIVLAWPLAVLILASGLLYGVITLSYQVVRGDQCRRNTRLLNEEVNQDHIKLDLAQRLLKIKRNLPKHQNKKVASYSKYAKKNEIELSNLIDEGNEHARLIPKSSNQNIPKIIYPRMALGIAGQIICAISLAMMVSLGVIWIATILLPIIPLLVPTLVLGGFFSIFYIFKSMQKEGKLIQTELNKIQEVAELKQALVSKYKDKHPLIGLDLNKDNSALLKEVLQEYIEFINKSGGKVAKHPNGKYPKQEKIFSVIESVTGLKRPEDASGRLLLTGNDKFYNEIAKYLKGNSKNSAEANAITQQFKNLFHSAKTNTVNADDPKINKTENTVSVFLKDNGLMIAGVIALGLMLPLFLCPQTAIVLLVAAVVISGFAIAKYAARKSNQNVEKLNQEKAKFSLIDRKYKLCSHSQSLDSSMENAIGIKNAVTKAKSFEKSHQETLEKSKAIFAANDQKPAPLKQISEKIKLPPLRPTLWWAEVDRQYSQEKLFSYGPEPTMLNNPFSLEPNFLLSKA